MHTHTHTHTQSYMQTMSHPTERQKHTRTLVLSHSCAQYQNWAKYACESCQKCDHYLAVGVASKVAIEINTETCLHPPGCDTNNYHNDQVVCQTGCLCASCCTRSMLLHELAEISGVDKQQAQNSADFYFYFLFLWLYKLERRQKQRNLFLASAYR